MKVIEERSSIYGSFEGVAEKSQELKTIMEPALNFADNTAKEALEMILHKLARIANSEDGWKVIDNVRDIVGYAKLWEEHLQKVPGSVDTVVEYKKIK